MKTVARSRSLAAVLAIGLILGALPLSGCQSRREYPKTGRPCPVCRKETRTMPLASLTYTTCVCPECESVATLNAASRAAVEDYTGTKAGDTVEVCTHCQIIVERCKACRKAKGR